MKTLQDIRSLGPCYDPNRYLPEDWLGDAKTILEHPEIPPLDKIWVVKHWVDDKVLQLFAAWCTCDAYAAANAANADNVAYDATNAAHTAANADNDVYAAANAAYAAADGFLYRAIGELHRLIS